MKNSETILKLYSLTIINSFVAERIIVVELVRRTAICVKRRAGNTQPDIIKTADYANATVDRGVAMSDA